MPAGGLLAEPKTHPVAEPQLAADFCEGGTTDQRCANPRQIALIGLGLTLIELGGDDKVQQSIAEELQPLVVLTARTAMPQGLFQQRLVVELIANGALKRGQCRCHEVLTLTASLNWITNDRFANNATRTS